MNHDPRRISTPGNSRKRKEREYTYTSTSSTPLVPQTTVSSRAVKNPNPNPNETTSYKLAEPISSNRLLAGYMAYEFLTKGTLLGQRYGSARDEPAEPSGKSKPESYAEVADLLKSDAAHVAGVVNPTQLASWIQM